MTSLSFIVLEICSLFTLIDSLPLVEGVGDLLSPFFGYLGWPEGDGDLRSELGSEEIDVSS